jgi:hypothetical protein
MVAVTVKPRDVIISFNDSCNCFRCFKPKTNHVYITHDGSLENFNQRKARDGIESAFNRAITNLNLTLNRNVTAFEGDPEEFKDKIRLVMQSIYDVGHITTSHIDSINNIMIDYLISKQKQEQVEELSGSMTRRNLCH